MQIGEGDVRNQPSMVPGREELLSFDPSVIPQIGLACLHSVLTSCVLVVAGMYLGWAGVMSREEPPARENGPQPCEIGSALWASVAVRCV